MSVSRRKENAYWLSDRIFDNWLFDGLGIRDTSQIFEEVFTGNTLNGMVRRILLFQGNTAFGRVYNPVYSQVMALHNEKMRRMGRSVSLIGTVTEVITQLQDALQTKGDLQAYLMGYASEELDEVSDFLGRRINHLFRSSGVDGMSGWGKNFDNMIQRIHHKGLRKSITRLNKNPLWMTFLNDIVYYVPVFETDMIYDAVISKYANNLLNVTY